MRDSVPRGAELLRLTNDNMHDVTAYLVDGEPGAETLHLLTVLSA